MPKRQNVRQRPVDYVLSGEWPEAQLEPSVPAEYARAFSRHLKRVTEGESLRAIGNRADLDPMTIRAFLRGDRWPDMASVAKLESAYRELLWPRDAERRYIMRVVLGTDPIELEEKTTRQLYDAAEALNAAWLAHFGSAYVTGPDAE